MAIPATFGMEEEGEGFDDFDLESLPLAQSFVTVNPNWPHPAEEVYLTSDNSDAEDLHF